MTVERWFVMRMGQAAVVVSGTAIMIAVPNAYAATVPGEVVAIEGSTPMGASAAVTNVRQPFVNAAGQVGFIGTLAGNDTFLFIEDEVVWLATDEVPALTGLQPHVATFDGGGFVVSGSAAGMGVLWTESGALVMQGDLAPGFPLSPAAAFTNLQRPTAAGSDDVVWRGVVDLTGDGFANAVGLFRRPAVGGGAIEALYVGGGTVDGVEISDSISAVTIDFAVSDDGTHVLVELDAAGSTLTDGVLALDDTIVVREGDPVPSFPAESWGPFDLMSVNDGGNYVFSGDSSAPTNADEYVALNGDIVLHEGDVVDGVLMTAAVRFVAINDNDQIAFGWASNPAGSINEHVFVACSPEALAAPRLLLSTDDEIDLDGDTIGDLTVEDLVLITNDPGRTLGDDNAVFLEVDLDPGGLNAIVRIPFACCGNGEVDGGETCDDANDDDTDDCLSTCQSAECGDGFVEAGVEACDDGNIEDGDGCDAMCAVEDPATSSTGTGADEGSTSTTGAESSTGVSTSPTGGEATTGQGETGTSTTSGSGGVTTSGTSGTSEGLSTTSSSTGGGDSSSGTDTDSAAAAEDGCGCTTDQDQDPPFVWALLLAVGSVIRRRRRHGSIG